MTLDDIIEIHQLQTDHDIIEERRQFYIDVIAGLRADPKKLSSKYFYDAKGDQLFQEIMGCDDYYLSRCEMEIFTSRSCDMFKAVTAQGTPFHLIELGPGDCTKSWHLLKVLVDQDTDFTYVPIDISKNVIRDLEVNLQRKLSKLKMQAQIGDYMEMLKTPKLTSNLRKVVLCLGGNIGNMSPEDTVNFNLELRKSLKKGDLCIIGFDLKKDPEIIQRAYDDSQGITSAFNLNLLERMNRELESDFRIEDFKRYSNYDPETGASKSYLVCKKDLEIHFPDVNITFKKDECIWMEISQKYNLDEIDKMAFKSGFRPVDYFMDSKNWFCDVLWIAD